MKVEGGELGGEDQYRDRKRDAAVISKAGSW